MAKVCLDAKSSVSDTLGGGLLMACIELSADVNAFLAFAAVGLETNRVSLIMQKPEPRGATMKHLKKMF